MSNLFILLLIAAGVVFIAFLAFLAYVVLVAIGFELQDEIYDDQHPPH